MKPEKEVKLKLERDAKFTVSQLVWWNDPEKEASGFYRVISDPYDEILSETDTGDYFMDDRIILIGNGYSEVEVYPCELEIRDEN